MVEGVYTLSTKNESTYRIYKDEKSMRASKHKKKE